MIRARAVACQQMIGAQGAYRSAGRSGTEPRAVRVIVFRSAGRSSGRAARRRRSAVASRSPVSSAIRNSASAASPVASSSPANACHVARASIQRPARSANRAQPRSVSRWFGRSATARFQAASAGPVSPRTASHAAYSHQASAWRGSAARALRYHGPDCPARPKRARTWPRL